MAVEVEGTGMEEEEVEVEEDGRDG